MKNYFVQNHLSLLIIAFLVLSGIGGGVNLGSGTPDRTFITNPWTFEQSVTLSSATNGDLTVAGDSSFATTSVKEFTQGGGVLSIDPVTASLTLTQANLLSYNVITFPASTTQPALTVTFPASSTLTTLLPNAGDYRSWVIENPFTAAATTTTIAAGTGIDLQEPDGQNVVIGINNYAWITCFREVSTDVVCSVDETIPAD